MNRVTEMKQRGQLLRGGVSSNLSVLQNHGVGWGGLLKHTLLGSPSLLSSQSSDPADVGQDPEFPFLTSSQVMFLQLV